MSDKLKVVGMVDLEGRYQVFRVGMAVSPVFPRWEDARDFVVAHKWAHMEKADRPGAIEWLVRDDPAINIRCGVEIDAATDTSGLADIL